MDTKNPYIIKMEGFKMGERRKFDKAFKEQAVLRILSSETTVNKMA